MESNGSAARVMPRALLAAWAALTLFCTIWYWPGLTSWFQGDDFVWMHTRAMVRGWSDLPTALFKPNSLGTARFLSERIYFLAVQALWGPSAAAFHAIAGVTWAASLLLLMGIAHKLFRSVPARRCRGGWTLLGLESGDRDGDRLDRHVQSDPARPVLQPGFLSAARLSGDRPPRLSWRCFTISVAFGWSLYFSTMLRAPLRSRSRSARRRRRGNARRSDRSRSARAPSRRGRAT